MKFHKLVNVFAILVALLMLVIVLVNEALCLHLIGWVFPFSTSVYVALTGGVSIVGAVALVLRGSSFTTWMLATMFVLFGMDAFSKMQVIAESMLTPSGEIRLYIISLLFCAGAFLLDRKKKVVPAKQQEA